jgi:hypothetical protein
MKPQNKLSQFVLILFLVFILIRLFPLVIRLLQIIIRLAQVYWLPLIIISIVILFVLKISKCSGILKNSNDPNKDLNARDVTNSVK